MNPEPVVYRREMRGIPLWLLEEYLVELGAERVQPGLVAGEGWSARLEQMPDFRVGSLKVGQLRLEVQATPQAWQALQPALEKKLLRAGG
jgi:hypothetical protein